MENICQEAIYRHFRNLYFRGRDIYGNSMIFKNQTKCIYHGNINFDFQLQMDYLQLDFGAPMNLRVGTSQLCLHFTNFTSHFYKLDTSTSIFVL